MLFLLIGVADRCGYRNLLIVSTICLRDTENHDTERQ